MADTESKQIAKGGALTSSQPWPPFQALRSEVDRLFNIFDGGAWRSPFGRSLFDYAPFERLSTSGNAPAVDIVDKDKEYEITAELPGIDAKNVEVSLSNGGIVIKGHKKEEKEETKKDFFLSERRYGSFERYFALPDGVDASKIAASYKDGVLTITLPKSAEVKAAERTIAIKTS